jgi:hypothetical protein
MSRRRWLVTAAVIAVVHAQIRADRVVIDHVEHPCRLFLTPPASPSSHIPSPPTPTPSRCES